MDGKIFPRLALGLLSALSPALLSAGEYVYVSPKGCDRSGDGTAGSPYYSLSKAVEGRLHGRGDTLFVMVAGGCYEMASPLAIRGGVSRPVVIRGEAGTKPSFSGGVRIEGWESYGNGMYRAFVPEVARYGFTFEQLYVDGRRATLARQPDSGWYKVQGSKEYPYVAGIRAADYAVQRIGFDAADWATLRDGQSGGFDNLKFRFYHKWDITHKRADFIDVDSGFVYTRGEGMKPWNPVRKGSRYIMYDYFGALTAPGEWYLDRSGGYVYYIPLEGQDMFRSECYAPALERLVEVNGTPDAPVRNISFENIAFRHTAYLTPAQGEEPRQAAAYASAAIELCYAENVRFVDCEMEHTGGYALWFKEGCRDNSVQRCYIADLGAGGIKIGVPWLPEDERAVSRRNVVDNNIITRTGNELPSGVGVAIFHAADNRVTHNDIFDLRYSGVSVGWVWGYNDSDKLWADGLDGNGNVVSLQRPIKNPATGNVVAYNRIHHIGWGELSDMGAVYTLGESPGTKVTHNVIHDVVSYDYGGWGLYTDEGSTGVEMSFNLVYRCKSGGFHQHYGKDNKIENNIFAFGSLHQLQFSRVEPHTSFSFRHNIILQDRGETLRGAWDKARIEMDSNLYWHMDGRPSFLSYKTMEEWRKVKDAHSIVADPMFVDAKRDDFRFRSKKSIRKIGFVPFDYSEAGVYGDEGWRRRAAMPDEAQAAFARVAAGHGF